MSNLLKAEVNRWFSRRLWWAMLLAAVALAGLSVLSISQVYAPQTPAEIAQAEKDWQNIQSSAQQDLQECIDDGNSAEDCREMLPSRSNFIRDPPTYQTLVEVGAQSAGQIAQLAALIVAASFIGAEFKSGSLATWLTYVPRRVPVFASKALVAVLGSAVLGVVVHALVQGGIALLAANWLGAAGLTGATEGWQMVGRTLVVVVGSGLFGFCLAALFGSTIAPLAGLLGVFVVLMLVGGLLQSVPVVAWLIVLLPDNNLNAYIYGSWQTSYYERAASGSDIERVLRIELGQASLYLACLMAVIVAVTLWRFTRREVR
ncbi:ABC transporter permease subunit [Micropruina glycogenica]|uniref:ABC-2 family transporter protein n=1 Tax=Micropruina glycogenica TaxID=75385 RepID=A0A2N9JKP7_9ACTN|nr:ABC transporter permease subunit [Micropruina glycogenica]SPD88614.1 conserved membrane protein of unknown function [Micropruina glycogenica]